MQQRLIRDLRALDRVPTGLAADLRDRTDERAAVLARRRQRRRRASLAVAATVTVTGGIAGLAWLGTSRDTPDTVPVAAPVTVAVTDTVTPVTPDTTVPDTTVPDTTVPDTTVPATAALPSSVAQLVSEWASVWGTIVPSMKLGTALPLAAVWTGTEAIVVVSGADEVRLTVAYDPVTESWRSLADAPAAVGDEIAAWTGAEVLLLGGSNGLASAYDPVSDTWRELGTPTGPMPTGHMLGGERGLPYAWTGTELLIWSEVGDGANVAGLQAYQPATDTWRTLAAPPEGFYRRRAAASVWTGTEWLLWGGNAGSSDFADGAAYDPVTDTWRMLSESPLQARRAAGIWTGDELLVIAGSAGGINGQGEMALADGAAYDPATDTWRSLTPGVAHPGLQPVWTGRYAVMFFKGTAAVYDPVADAWIDTCCGNGGPGASRIHVWTGTQVISFDESPSAIAGTTFTPPSGGES